MATTDSPVVDTFSIETALKDYTTSPVWKPWYPYITAVFLLIMTAGLACNGLLITAFWKHISKKTLTDCLICSLSCSDLLSLLSETVFHFFLFTERGLSMASQSRSACLVSLAALHFAGLSSLLLTFILSIQRLMAVRTPVRFKNQKKKKGLLVFVLLPWCLIIPFVSPPLFGWNEWTSEKRCTLAEIYTRFCLGCFAIAPTFLILLMIPVINSITLVALLKQQRKVAQRMTSQKIPAEKSEGSLTMTQMSARRHMEVSKTLFIIVICLYACTLPLITVIIISRFRKEFFSQNILYEIASDATRPLFALSSTLNPLIYVRRNPRFREAFRNIGRRWKGNSE